MLASMTITAHSPAAERNKQPILEVLLRLLPAHGRALEIASGTGQHAAWFAAALPGWTWQPSDRLADDFDAIASLAARHGVGNMLPPVLLDVTAPQWPVAAGSFDLVYCANMLHIAPWHCTADLLHGSARHLAPEGVLVTYGPYLEHGVPTAEGNLAFDRSLRQRDPSWGIRQREEVEAAAAQAGLRLAARHAMPANNLLLEWRMA